MSTTTGAAPSAESFAAFSDERVVPTTLCPFATSSGTGRFSRGPGCAGEEDSHATGSARVDHGCARVPGPDEAPGTLVQTLPHSQPHPTRATITRGPRLACRHRPRTETGWPP